MSDARKMAGNPNSAGRSDGPDDGRGGAGNDPLALGVTDATHNLDSRVNLGDGDRGSVGADRGWQS
jgi:hypothetical protein